MPRTRAPHHRILERLLQRTMNLIAHILDGGPRPHDQSLAEVRINTLALRVDAHQSQLLPAALNHVLDAQI